MLDAKTAGEFAALAKLSPVFLNPSDCDASRNPQLAALYENGKQQWNAATDLNWNVDTHFGSPLPNDSSFALSCFETSPLARYGLSMWNSFRWEFQAWMVSQFLPGEQAALAAATRLMQAVPEFGEQLCLAEQVVDEARHIEAFSRYLREKVPVAYGPSRSFAVLLYQTLSDRRWDITMLGTQILVEALALAAFRMANRTFHDDLIREICRRVAQDEVRHVSIGVLRLRNLYLDMTAAELREREQFVMEAFDLIMQKFMLEEIWDHLGLDRHEGLLFARTSPLMIEYRQIICSQVVASLFQIGLMTRRLCDRLTNLDILGSRHRVLSKQSWRDFGETSAR
jgi:hypothetical protein